MDRDLPFVSIIVPVFNGSKTIELLLRALATQDYPAKQHELIIVDNGSTDDTIAKIDALRGLFLSPPIVLEEANTRGSYAARNRGLEIAKGEILAFTDADCTPVSNWLSAGVSCLLQGGADLAGGQVTFTFASDHPTSAELIDSRSNMQMELDILTRGVSKTANLFARKSVFDAIGAFPAKLKSGGDVVWTSEATRSGYRIAFAPKAEVYHPARSWRELFVKQLRVGRGQVPAMRAQGMPWTAILKDSFRTRRRKRHTPREATSASRSLSRQPFGIGLFFALIWSRGATLLGRFIGLWEIGRHR